MTTEVQTDLQTDDVQTAVARGAELLDSRFGSTDWASYINVETFNISEFETCVLGQLFPNSDSAGHRNFRLSHTDYLMGLSIVVGDMSEESAVYYGFNNGWKLSLYPWGELNNEWLKAIKARLINDLVFESLHPDDFSD